MTLFAGKLLDEGQVSNSEGAIYTVPALTTAYIKGMTFTHSSATPQTLIIYVRQGAGTSRVIYRCIMDEDYSLGAVGSIALNAGDTIRAQTTTASVMDYTIYGIEES
jgi:hypothetical protein